MTLSVVLNRCEMVSHIKEGTYPEGLQNHGAEENSCLLARESHIDCRKIQSKKVHNFYFLPNFITYLLTSWTRILLEKLTGRQLIKNLPRILLNTKVHHRTHKRTPPVPILSQLHSVHTPTYYFPKIYPNIFLPSTPGFPQWSPSLRFPHQNPVHTSSLPHTRYMPRPSHASILKFHIKINSRVVFYFRTTWECVDIRLARGRAKWQSLVNTAMRHRVPDTARNSLTS